jgi:hypothetical protein
MQHEPANNGGHVTRTYCSVLWHMRELLQACFTDKNISTNKYVYYDVPANFPLIVLSLIEELQVYGSRMESHIADFANYKEMKENAKKLKTEIKELEEKKNKLIAGNTQCLY